MAEDLKIKSLHADAIPKAVEKAEHYRLLNEPEQAESICRDILRADPVNQRALVTVILAITDQFSSDHHSPDPRKAREYLGGLTDAYQRNYYAGLIYEREARALIARGRAAAFAYDGLREAMSWYEKAETQSPPGVDDAILRWNACLRTIRSQNLRPHEQEPEHPLE